MYFKNRVETIPFINYLYYFSLENFILNII